MRFKPDHGTFKSPHWEDEEIDLEYTEKCIETWVQKYNVSLIGGCCGLGRDFIKLIQPIVSKLQSGDSPRSIISSEHECKSNKCSHHHHHH